MLVEKTNANPCCGETGQAVAAAAGGTGAPIDQARIVLVDPHWAVREGVRVALAKTGTAHVVAEYDRYDKALAEVRNDAADVIVFEPAMQPGDLSDAIRRLRLISAANILVFTCVTDDYMMRAALRAGAVGFLVKEAGLADVANAIHLVARGQVWLHASAQRLLVDIAQGNVTDLNGLSRREQEILELLCEGRANKDIAAHLGLSEGTIKSHISRIISKFGLADRTQVALYAIHNGLVNPHNAQKRLASLQG